MAATPTLEKDFDMNGDIKKEDEKIGREFFDLGDFDMYLASPVARSLRLNGVSTCIRIEGIYWKIINYAASQRDTTIGALLSSTDREVQYRFGGVRNFSSLVRVLSVAQLFKYAPDSLARSLSEEVR
jgi:predicted DNA-binding ribbon-helix-helix protein